VNVLADVDLQVRYPNDATAEEVATGIIEDCGGDPTAAVVTLVGIVAMLLKQKEALVRASSPGFARLRPTPRRL
jgi:hypothetical protein